MVRRYPVVDTGICSLCLGCIECAPEVFSLNYDLNIVEVRDLQSYEEKGVEEAILLCPLDCIEWDSL